MIPQSITQKMLNTLHISITSWNNTATQGVLIIGRKAFSMPSTHWAHSMQDFELFAKGGGTVLVFVQDSSWLQKYCGFRVAKNLTRYVFPVIKNSPILDTLDAFDLCNWSGSGNMIDSVNPLPDYLGSRPVYEWHWYNRGSVASWAIEKPHYGSWRPILECEFDGAYTPLMEMDYGKGRVILCQLDLENRVDGSDADPAARQLAHNLIRYAQTPKPVRNTSGVFLLDDRNSKGAKILFSLGIKFQMYDPNNNPNAPVIVGPEIPWNDSRLNKLRRVGNVIIYLHRTNDQFNPLNIFSDHLPLIPTDCIGSTDVPDWPFTKGLSPSDLRWRNTCSAYLLDEN